MPSAGVGQQRQHHGHHDKDEQRDQEHARADGDARGHRPEEVQQIHGVLHRRAVAHNAQRAHHAQ